MDFIRIAEVTVLIDLIRIAEMTDCRDDGVCLGDGLCNGLRNLYLGDALCDCVFP